MNMKKWILTIGAVVSLAFGAAAITNGGGNSANAPGQVNAAANCGNNIAKQFANGQTGANTGSGNDSKQLNTSVTNCDHFWN
jgi:hypothetical protein